MSNKLKEIFEKVNARNRKTIRRKIRRLIFMCSGFSILILTFVTLYGMFGVRSDSIETGENIGEFAIENSNKIIARSTHEYLKTLARERSHLINMELEDFKGSVEVIQREVTRVMNNPSAYPYRNIKEANPNDGDGEHYEAWLFYAPNFLNSSAIQNEIGLMANVQDTMIGLAEWIGDGLSITPYIASNSGFIIEVDNKLPEWAFPDKTQARAQTFNFYERPWFSRAESEGKLFFTRPYQGGREGNLAISCAMPYYYSNGEFAGVVGIGASLDRVSDLVLNTEITGGGFCFILDNEGHILFSQMQDNELSIISVANQKDLRQSENLNVALVAKEMLKGIEGSLNITIDDTNYIVTFAPIPTTGWSFGIAIEDTVVKKFLEENRAFISAETQTQARAIGERIFETMLLICAAIAIIIVVVGYFGNKLSKSLASPLLELADKVRKISSGKFDEKIEIHTGDEIEHLATCFNAMTSELQEYMNNLTKVTSEKQKISTELNVATNIQIGMLPHDFNFGRADFDIFATMHAAKAVGGDFYDFYLLDENHLVVTMADVSGKGVPAALFMSRSKTILKNFAMTMSNPDDFAALMTLANQQLCQDNEEMMFVTVFMGMLDLKTGRFIFVNGGHNPPVIYRKATGKFEYLDVKRNCVLGMIEGIDFVQQEIQIDAGDLIYLYTDGVTEAMDVDNNQYGEQRLIECLSSIDIQEPLEKILQDIRADLEKHVGAAEQSDDITMLAVRYIK